MPKAATVLNELKRAFLLTNKDILLLSASFHQAMLRGLHGQPSPLKMLPSFLSAPDGSERGLYLALDFGGTNVRVLLVELHGNSQYTILARRQTQLKDVGGRYDYTTSLTSADELFDFIASEVAQIVPSDKDLPLGHTFSFPSRQQDINNALLINWTKELAVSGIEGHNVTKLLAAALMRTGLTRVRPVAIINDTVGTLLTAAYTHQNSCIGSICGTGHNSAYLEPHYRTTDSEMIINMESGNFDKLPLTNYDCMLDAASEKPGHQLLEKAVSGRYLGELLRLILCDLVNKDLISPLLSTPYYLSAEDIAFILTDATPALSNIAKWLVEGCHIGNWSIEDRLALKEAAELLVNRSASFVAASYLGVIQHIDPELERNHHIAIDGSLFEKMPGYAQTITRVLHNAHGVKANKITTGLTKDGSGVGAAIAAALALL